MRTLLSTLLLLVPALALAQSRNAVRGELPVLPFPTGSTQTINVLQWDPNTLPKIYQRSDQLPLTDEEISKLSKAASSPSSS